MDWPEDRGGGQILFPVASLEVPWILGHFVLVVMMTAEEGAGFFYF